MIISAPLLTTLAILVNRVRTGPLVRKPHRDLKEPVIWTAASIRAFRIMVNLPAYELAHCLGVTTSHLQQVEQGTRKPSRLLSQCLNYYRQLASISASEVRVELESMPFLRQYNYIGD